MQGREKFTYEKIMNIGFIMPDVPCSVTDLENCKYLIFVTQSTNYINKVLPHVPMLPIKYANLLYF